MALPCPGPSQISIADIQTEFGGSNPIAINEYYRNGLYVPSSSTNVPTSGQISFSDFFCTSSELTLIISVTTTNLNLQSAFDAQFGANTWTNSLPKRVIINPGVVVGSSNICSYALKVTSGGVGNLRIDNYGSIQGAGGGSNSGMGGNAILADSPVSINNQGSIYGGGGGGGQGGQGGPGSYTNYSTTSSCGPFETAPGCPEGYSQYEYGTGSCCQTYSYCCGLFNCACVACAQYQQYRYCYQTIVTAGSPGGTGGTGQGYGQNATGGTGSYDPGGYAGIGGNGGTGGTFGQNGSTGSSGASGNAGGPGSPGPGGYAGFYVTRSSNITWTNLGTVAGRSDSFLSPDGFVVLIIANNTVDLNLQTAFDNTFGYQIWNNGVPKRLIINPGVVIGGSSNGTYAINIPAGLCGPLEIINYGSVQGAGAPYGYSSAGGNAIYAGSSVTINNQGSIYGGGGGGGQGGTGGLGYYAYWRGVGPGYQGAIGNCQDSCNYNYFDTTCIDCGYEQTVYAKGGSYLVSGCNNCAVIDYTYSGGSPGGLGGQGQGYAQNASAGLGSYDPGYNAGTGGQGGTGGAFGQYGGYGFTGGSGNASGGNGGYPGGPPGYYIVGGGNVTWTSFGSRLGLAG